MRAYNSSSEEALHSRDLLKDWAGEGFINQAQYQRLQEETVCDLRRTNIFLRLVLFLFTLLIVVAAVALFFVVLGSPSATPSMGILALFFAGLSYAAMEVAVSQGRLYRFGIEEGLGVCSVALLCLGLQIALFSGRADPPTSAGLEFLVPAAGAIASLWIRCRFGLPYATLAAMIFVIFVSIHWTSSHTSQHLIVAAFYSAGLLTVMALRRPYRFTYLNNGFSIDEALLWLGIYLALNLQLWSSNLLDLWSTSRALTEFSRPFYWTTWVLIWCLPPAVIVRGLRQKDRFVIVVGALIATLTLVTNKPYLGWARHPWDPMLMGALLIGVALLIQRWLAAGPGKVRRGFTAQRLSGKDKTWMEAGSAALGFASQNLTTVTPQTSPSDFHFGGGDAGGGGASSDF